MQKNETCRIFIKGRPVRKFIIFSKARVLPEVDGAKAELEEERRSMRL